MVLFFLLESINFMYINLLIDKALVEKPEMGLASWVSNRLFALMEIHICNYLQLFNLRLKLFSTLLCSTTPCTLWAVLQHWKPR